MMIGSLLHDAESVSLRDQNGFTPLFLAAHEGDLEMVQLLLDRMDGPTAADRAQARAAVRALNNAFLSAIEIAADAGHDHIVEVLRPFSDH